MEQNSETAEVASTPETQNVTETAAAPAAEAAATETAAPRRRSRRATAAVGEAVDPASVPEGAPAVEAAAAAPVAEAPAAAEPAPAAEVIEPAPKKRVSRSRKKVEAAPAEAEAAPAEAAAENAPAAEAAAAEGGDATPVTRSRAASTRTRKPKATAETAADAAAETAADAATGEPVAEASDAAASDAAANGAASDADAETATTPRRRASRGRGRKAAAEAGDDAATANEQAENAAENGEQASTDGAAQNGADRNGDRNGADRGGNQNGNDRNNQRSSRTRQRERKRRGQGDDFEPEIADDDVLLPIAGILDVLENYAFVRTSGYLPGTNDVYVSLGQVKKYNLRKGDAVVGAIRQPRDGDSGSGRQKYNAIVRLDTVNSRPAEENETRADFADFTPIHPNERLRLETGSADLTQRVIDLFAPIGKGQRGLIVGPHESGKSTALREIASAVAANQADAHLMLVLLDERPEEVTELTRTVNGEVIASTFDRTAEDHVTIAELAVERAKRLVELGHDVVLLIDSLTSLARSYNVLASAASRVPAGSLDAAAIHPVKKLLSAARNLENGGSLTIIATVSAQPGSNVDDAVIGELEATANMQLRLSGDAADRRVYPAVELRASATRRAELITSEAEAKVMDQQRRSIAEQSPAEALEAVLGRLAGTSSNVEFLALTQRSN